MTYILYIVLFSSLISYIMFHLTCTYIYILFVLSLPNVIYLTKYFNKSGYNTLRLLKKTFMGDKSLYFFQSRTKAAWLEHEWQDRSGQLSLYINSTLFTLVDAHRMDKTEQRRCTHLNQIVFVDLQLTEPEITFIKTLTGSEAQQSSNAVSVVFVFQSFNTFSTFPYGLSSQSSKAYSTLHRFLQAFFSLFTFTLFLLIIFISKTF